MESVKFCESVKFICLGLKCVIAIMLVPLGMAHRDAINISTVCYLNLSEHFIYFRHCEVAGLHTAQTQSPKHQFYHTAISDYIAGDSDDMFILFFKIITDTKTFKFFFLS